MTRLAPALLLLLVSGCAASTTRSPVGDTRPVPVAYPTVGLERVLGQNAAGLVQLFGQPDADVREGTARKLQFTGPICVLDAYLYPGDRGEPRVTWLDAREPDGSGIDRASCVAALIRRDGGR